MLCDEVIERFKAKIPNFKGDHRIYGITQLDIECEDETVKQIVLLFERLRVDEPDKVLQKQNIYADVLVKIKDEVLIDIASKEISLQDAIDQRMFKVYGDGDIWKLQLEALRNILPNEEFKPRLKKPPTPTPEEDNEIFKDWVDYGSLPKMDLADVPDEFKMLTDHFASLRDKYNGK